MDAAAEQDLVTRLRARSVAIADNCEHGVTGVNPNAAPAKALVITDFPESMGASQGFFVLRLSEAPEGTVSGTIRVSNDDLLGVTPSIFEFDAQTWDTETFPILAPKGIPSEEGVDVELTFEVSGGDFEEASTTRMLRRVR